MRVRITVEDLRIRGACKEGIDKFERDYPEGIDVEWTDQHSEWARANWSFTWWLEHKRLIPRVGK